MRRLLNPDIQCTDPGPTAILLENIRYGILVLRAEYLPPGFTAVC